MEYIYAALLLHKTGKPVSAESITKIMQAAGVQIDESKVKSLVASLKDVDIEAELANAAVASAAASAASSAQSAAPKQEEKKQEKAEESAAGLSALFG